MALQMFKGAVVRNCKRIRQLTVCKLKISPAVLGVVVGSKRLQVYKLRAYFMSIAETRGPCFLPLFPASVLRGSGKNIRRHPATQEAAQRNSKLSKTGTFARASSMLPLALRLLSPNPRLFAF